MVARPEPHSRSLFPSSAQSSATGAKVIPQGGKGVVDAKGIYSIDRDTGQEDFKAGVGYGIGARAVFLPVYLTSCFIFGRSKTDQYIGGLSMKLGELPLGIIMLGGGVLILRNAEWLIQNAIDSGNNSFGRLGIPQASERSRRVGGKIIVTLVGWFFILAGLFQLAIILTGYAGFQ